MNWSQVTKYLDYVRGSVNTSRAKSRGVAREIKKLNYAFTIANVVFPAMTIIPKMFVHQVNYTMPGDFIIIGAEMGSELSGKRCVMCIRYREDGVVYRYRLPRYDNFSDDLAGTGLDNAYLNAYVKADKYTNQLIKANFCIEYWGVDEDEQSDNPSWVYTTSLIRNPLSADEIGPVIYTSGTAVTRDSIANNFPEALPTPYPAASQWLNN